jgi:hypothetical protein
MNPSEHDDDTDADADPDIDDEILSTQLEHSLAAVAPAWELPPPSYGATEPKITLSPRAVAVVSLVVGVACLAALSIVASLKHADALATIALAIAIVSLGIQLLVTAAQNKSTTEQSVRSEQLNTQTRALLAEMQTTARNTETMVRGQFGQLLHAFMDAAKAAEGGKQFNEAAFEQRLLENMRRESALAQTQSSTPRSLQATSAGALRSARTLQDARDRARARQQERADQYDAGPFPPEDEGRLVLDDLLQLSPAARTRLKLFAADKADNGGGSEYVGFPPGGPLSELQPLNEELEKPGFLHLVRFPGEGAPGDGLLYQLTEKGDVGARVLGASGDIPTWAAPLFRS